MLLVRPLSLQEGAEGATDREEDAKDGQDGFYLVTLHQMLRAPVIQFPMLVISFRR